MRGASVGAVLPGAERRPRAEIGAVAGGEGPVIRALSWEHSCVSARDLHLVRYEVRRFSLGDAHVEPFVERPNNHFRHLRLVGKRGIFGEAGGIRGDDDVGTFRDGMGDNLEVVLDLIARGDVRFWFAVGRVPRATEASCLFGSLEPESLHVEVSEQLFREIVLDRVFRDGDGGDNDSDRALFLRPDVKERHHCVVVPALAVH